MSSVAPSALVGNQKKDGPGLRQSFTYLSESHVCQYQCLSKIQTQTKSGRQSPPAARTPTAASSKQTRPTPHARIIMIHNKTDTDRGEESGNGYKKVDLKEMVLGSETFFGSSVAFKLVE